jgi:hypothetical protein
MATETVRIFVHKHGMKDTHDDDFYSFVGVPRVGELVFLGRSEPWYRVDQVLNSAEPYQSEIFVTETDLGEVETQAIVKQAEVTKKNRLCYLPETGTWQLEKVGDDGVIYDFAELSAEGAAMRYSKDELQDALLRAVDGLEEVSAPEAA